MNQISQVGVLKRIDERLLQFLRIARSSIFARGWSEKLTDNGQNLYKRGTKIDRIPVCEASPDEFHRQNNCSAL